MGTLKEGEDDMGAINYKVAQDVTYRHYITELVRDETGLTMTPRELNYYMIYMAMFIDVIDSFLALEATNEDQEL